MTTEALVTPDNPYYCPVCHGLLEHDLDCPDKPQAK